MKKVSKLNKRLFMSAVFVSMFMNGVMPVFAGEYGGFGDGLQRLFDIIRAVATPIAVIGMAVCGFKFITGNDKDAVKTKKAAVIILISLGIIYLLPLLINFGANAVSGYKWKPSAGN